MLHSRNDIQRLNDVPIEQVAERLGLKVVRHKSLCPFHDDSRPSLTFNGRTNRYRCYVCDAHGDNVSLVMNTQQWAFGEACRWLATEFGVVTAHYLSAYGCRPVREQPPAPAPRPAAAIPPADTRYLEQLVSRPTLIPEARRFLFDERRLSPGVVSWLGISSTAAPIPTSSHPHSQWFNAPSLLIPYRHADGTLQSLQARYLGEDGEKPRFQFPQGSRCSMFNLPMLGQLQAGDRLFISEGVTDCMALLSSGRKAIAIPSATLLRQEDVETVDKACGSQVELHMVPDRDEPGERLYLQLKQALPRLVRHQLPEGYKDFGQWWAAHAP